MASLEEEIKQKRFKNEHHKLALNIMFTASWLETESKRFFKKYNLTPQQYNVLRILRGQFPNPAPCNLIQERMLDRSSNITRLIDKLVLKKLVSRKENKLNRRMQDIVITDKGMQLLAEMDSLMDSWHQMLETLNNVEAKSLNELLDKLRG